MRSCRRSSRARCSTRTTPMTIGAMVGPEAFTEVSYLAHAKQLQALDAIPEVAAEFERGVRARRPAGSCAATAPRTPRPSSSRSARCSARSRTSSTSCASGGVRVGALAIRCFRPWPLEEVRAALDGRAAGRSCSRRRSRSASAGSSSPDVRLALEGLGLPVHDVVAGLGGRAITAASLRRLLGDGLAGRLADTDVPRPGPRARRARARERRRRSARTPRTCCATWAVAADRCDDGLTAVNTTRSAPSRWATGCSTPTQRTVQADACAPTRSRRGHRACQGCGEALGARYALDAAMRATGGRLIAANATGCLEVFSTPYPETSWRVPWLHSLFGNAPAVATGMAAALQGQGPRRHARGRPGRRRRDGRHRLRLPVGDVRAQRRRALHLLRQRGAT